jgi:hypothetical protein
VNSSDPRIRRAFVFTGLKQAGWIFLVLVLAGGLGLALMLFGESADAVWMFGIWIFGIAVSLLTGPITSVLTSFDISNRTLLVLWPLFLLPYWFCLGSGVALIRWRAQNPDTVTNQGILKSDLKTIRLGIGTAAVIVAALCFRGGPIGGPTHVPMRPAIRVRIMSNLRKIDGAKQQFASEKNLPLDSVPTESELASYLERGGGKFSHIGPERYVINPITKPPFAVLDSDWRFRRRGWSEGYTITNGTVFRLQ